MKRASPAIRLTREQVLSASKLGNIEARALVANYYAAQEMRKGTDMQIRHAGDKADSAGILKFTADRFADIEADTLKALGKYAEGSKIGQWMLSQTGIGPVIAAGYLAHFDITRAPTAGHFWSFAGLNPNAKWEKGQKRPWNAELKQIGFHAGGCIKRVSNHPDSYYGKLYRERKALLEQRNERGDFAERAKVFVAKSADWKKTLATGKLPAGNLDRQACNFVVKIFLSHLHALMYWDAFGKAPPKPFAMAILGHAHEISVPDTKTLFPGFADAYYGTAKIAKAA
jgi:hypothetical protein